MYVTCRSHSPVSQPAIRADKGGKTFAQPFPPSPTPTSLLRREYIVMHPTELPLLNPSTIRPIYNLQNARKGNCSNLINKWERPGEIKPKDAVVELYTVYAVIMDSVYIILFCGRKEACCVDCPCSSVQKGNIFRLERGKGFCDNVGLQMLKWLE